MPEMEMGEIMRNLQDHVNQLEEAGVVIDTAIVCWESSRFDDQGNLLRQIGYSQLTESSMSSGIGLLDAAHTILREDSCGRSPE